MRVVTYIDGDADPNPWDMEGKWIDNREEPIVRIGGEVFECRFNPECGAESFICDPRRSLVRPVFNALQQYAPGRFETADFLFYLMMALGFDLKNLDYATMMAFQSMFPRVASEHLWLSYKKIGNFNKCHADAMRVINNPFFYLEANAGEKRLLEIAEDCGLRFAVDLACAIPSVENLAKEIVLLNRIAEGADSMSDTYENLVQTIGNILGDK